MGTNTNTTEYKGRTITATPEPYFKGGWLHVGHVRKDDGHIVVDMKVALPGLASSKEEATSSIVAALCRQIDDEVTIMQAAGPQGQHRGLKRTATLALVI